MTFSDILQQQYKLSEDSIHLLLKDVTTISFNRKEPIVQEGQRNEYIYFVEKGSVRGFIEREGKEFTLLFAFEGDMAATMPNLSQTPTAKFTLETLESSTLVQISRSHLEYLFLHSLELANWGRKLMEKTMQEYEHYFIEYYWADKGHQYQILIKEYPQLLQRVSLKEIASYLNITPQSLSRIRGSLEINLTRASPLNKKQNQHLCCQYPQEHRERVHRGITHGGSVISHDTIGISQCWRVCHTSSH